MFITDLFEAKSPLKIVVILPGGFHPFHPGHLSLYNSAQKAFPGADIYYAATNDKSNRPFDITDKAKLAQIAGVPKGHFAQVTSPFQAREILSKYDPATTAVVFARSEKDRDEPPKAGGVKKDGSPSYLQPWNGKPKPLSQHGYMAYLPTVEFPAGPSGITSATQIRNMWPKANAKQKASIVQDLYPGNPKAAAQILNKYLGEDSNSPVAVDSTSPVGGVAEHIGKVKGGYRLYSHKGKNLGTFPSRAGAEKRERQVQYFKHKG